MIALNRLGARFLTPFVSVRYFASKEGDLQFRRLVRQVKADPAFKASPKKYVAAWIKRRGATEEWRIPEDAALRYFKRTVLKVDKQAERTFFSSGSSKKSKRYTQVNSKIGR